MQPRFCRDPVHTAIDIIRHTRNHGFGRFSQPRRPVFAHQRMIAPDAARGNDNRFGAMLELSHHFARGRYPPRSSRIFKDVTAHPFDRAILDDQTRCTVTEPHLKPPVCRITHHEIGEWFHYTRARPPCDMKPRHRIATLTGKGTAPLSPTDNREPTHAKAIQPAAHISCRELHKLFRPEARICVLLAVKLRRALPIAPRQFRTVTNTKAALLGTVDHEQSAQ